jgi:hypothetical protein
MRQEEIRWTCDRCGKEVVGISVKLPKGWMSHGPNKHLCETCQGSYVLWLSSKDNRLVAIAKALADAAVMHETVHYGSEEAKHCAEIGRELLRALDGGDSPPLELE